MRRAIAVFVILGVLGGLWFWLSSLLAVHVPIVTSATIETPGGPVPIHVRVHSKEDAAIHNGFAEATPSELRVGGTGTLRVRSIDWRNRTCVLEFASTGSTLEIRDHGPDDPRSGGTFTRMIDGEVSTTLPVNVHPRASDDSAWEPIETDDPGAEITGYWLMTRDGIPAGLMQGIRATDPLSGDTRPDISVRLSNFMIETRTMTGRIDGRTVRLAHFDGESPIHARGTFLDDDTIELTFWVGDWREHTFIASRIDE